MKNKSNNKKPDKFTITELFMARAGKRNWNHCYYGTIERHKDQDGNEVFVSGKIKMKDGYIWANAPNQDLLGEMLDELATLVFLTGIDYEKRIVINVAEKDLNLN